MKRVVLCLLAALIGVPAARVLYVHPDSTRNCIQECLNACNDCDTVLVGPGTYFENIVWPDVNSIKLISEYGRDTTFIDAGDSGRVVDIPTVVDSTTVVRGFTIRNGALSGGGGVGMRCANASSPVIERNRFTANRGGELSRGGGLCSDGAGPLVRFNEFAGNTAATGGAIELNNSPLAVIFGNDIYRNHADSWGGGINCNFSGSAVIDSNSITGNTAQWGGGIYVILSSPVISRNTVTHDSAARAGGGFGSGGATPLLIGNTIASNHGFVAGGVFSHISHPTLTANRITGNSGLFGAGVYSYSTSLVRIDNCIIDSNLGEGIYCDLDAGAAVRWSSITGNTGAAVRTLNFDAGVDAAFNWWGDSTGPYHATLNPGGRGDTVHDYVDFRPWLGSEVIHYVHPDSAVNTIQAALDASAANEGVCVGPGTYHENIVWPATRGIRLGSQRGRDSTVIDGRAGGSVINFVHAVDTTTVLSGLTITNGYAEYGGGVRCDTAASPLIWDNVITLNTAYGAQYGHGGGIGLVYHSSPAVRGNVISRNRAAGSWSGGGGIMVIEGGEPVIEDNTIEGNWSTAGGGGIMCHDYSAAVIRNNVIRYDTSNASGGGVCSQRARTVVYGNTITHNSSPAWYGGGVYTGNDDSSTVRCNEISRNFNDGVGIGRNNGSLIDSCTIADNAGQGIFVQFASTGVGTVVRHCEITDNGGQAVLKQSSDTRLDARENWWGHATGPFHPDSNPAGHGDTVSDYVDFADWLTSPIGVLEPPRPSLSVRAPSATIVRGVLMCPQLAADGSRQELLDITGRRVLALRPGRNDVSGLAPGVYFIRSATAPWSAAHAKVIISR